MKIILITLMFCMFSCNNKQNDSLINNTEINKKSIMQNNKEIEKILERQLKAGGYSSYYDTDYAYYKYDKSDLDVTFNPLKKILVNNGYKITDKDIFINKVKNIFGSIPHYNDIFYINSFDKCSKPPSINYYDPDGFRKDIYISIEYQIVVNLFSLPEIVDYQKEYKEIAVKEDEFPTEIIKDGGTEKIYLTKWKDIPDLAKQRKKNIDILVNRNKYLFNNNKASLAWLKFNDQDFLESLVKTFGYVADSDLLKWVIDRNLNDDEFDKLIFTKTCDGKYIFHKEIFEIMKQSDAKAKEKYLAFLREHFPKIDENNSNQEIRIQALYCYYSTKLSQNFDSSDLFVFFPRLNEDKFEEEFKKNNYYNISDFKELYKDTRYGGVGAAE